MSKQQELDRWIRDTTHFQRYSRWVHWFTKGPTSTLYSNSKSLEDQGLSSATLQEMAAGQLDPEEDRGTRFRRIRKKFQRITRVAIDDKTFIDPTERMRHKLDRFNLSGLPGLTASRCVRALYILKSLVAPRVSAAVLRTMWNGWTTSHRFQGSGSCVLRCSPWAKDKLEHYAVCPCLVKCAKKSLNLHPIGGGIQMGQFIALGLNEGTVSDETLVKRALGVYAAYRTVNHFSHESGCNASEVTDFFKQFIREAVRGHASSSSVLDNCYVTPQIEEEEPQLNERLRSWELDC